MPISPTGRRVDGGAGEEPGVDLNPASTRGLAVLCSASVAGVYFLQPLLGAVIALATLGLWAGAIALLLAGGAVTLAAMLARRQIGGYTGDVLGFFQQIGEIMMLLVAAAG